VKCLEEEMNRKTQPTTTKKT